MPPVRGVASDCEVRVFAYLRVSTEEQVFGRPRELCLEVEARILAERQAGGSYNGIARGLAADGVPTARSGRWHANTIKKICVSRAS